MYREVSESGGNLCLLVVDTSYLLDRHMNVRLPHDPILLLYQGSDGGSRDDAASPCPPFRVSIIYQGANVFERVHIWSKKVKKCYVCGKIQVLYS